jgi:hypothetical protein
MVAEKGGGKRQKEREREREGKRKYRTLCEGVSIYREKSEREREVERQMILAWDGQTGWQADRRTIKRGDGQMGRERQTGRLAGIKADKSNNKYSIQLEDKVIVNLLPQRLQSIGQENLKDKNVFQTD